MNLRSSNNRFWMVREMGKKIKIGDTVKVVGNLEIDEDSPYHYIELGSFVRVLAVSDKGKFIDVIGKSCDGRVITQVISARDVKLVKDRNGK